jgi:hypothetical protein
MHDSNNALPRYLYVKNQRNGKIVESPSQDFQVVCLRPKIAIKEKNRCSHPAMGRNTHLKFYTTNCRFPPHVGTCLETLIDSWWMLKLHTGCDTVNK